jgi:signal transduction histidine kinase
MTARRSVASRILLSYALVMAAFFLSAALSVVAQRNAAREAQLMRTGYLPLALALRDLVANQDTWNTQLNHVTAAHNPADKRVWFETALSIGRPKKFAEVRAKITHAFVMDGDAELVLVGRDLLRETTSIEQSLRDDKELVTQLFESLSRRNEAAAERLRDALVTRGFQAKKRLSMLERRVERQVDGLLDEARQREQFTIELSIGLVVLTLLVGLVMALYSRRVLRPLAEVTERAKAVARGDLTPRRVVASRDEIGELASTFERMVTAIARANEQLVAAERLATAGKMAANITHEIRNPLSSIALNVEMLEDEMQDNQEARQLLKSIGKEVDRLTALTEQYLTFARRQSPQFEEEDLGSIVEQAYDFMRPELDKHGVRCSAEIAHDLSPARVDSSQLKQAVYNLLRNAREAMAEGGEVRIVVRAAADDTAEIIVEDDGPGMDEDTRAHLFEPFYTTKRYGTGLGLAVTRQVIEAHGGQIRFEPNSPRGTRAVIRLPLALTPSPVAAAVVPSVGDRA